MDDSKCLRDKLLAFLQSQQGHYVSGPILAQRFGVSRTGIWKHIQQLRARGYQIESNNQLGYRLLQAPDILYPEEIHSDLKTKWLGKTYHHYLQIGSTNDKALQLAVAGAPHGTVVLAEHQTAGRGRFSRRWESPPNLGLTFSVVLRPPLHPREAPKFTLVTALAVARYLREAYRLNALIKWPNDILITGKKTGGILTEMHADQDLIRFVIIGIGININLGHKEMAKSFRYPATSVSIELGRKLSRVKFFQELLVYMEEQFDRILKEDFSSSLEELRALSATIGNIIEINCSGEIFRGYAKDLTKDGALRIYLEGEGTEKIIWAGDVTRVIQKG